MSEVTRVPVVGGHFDGYFWLASSDSGAQWFAPDGIQADDSLMVQILRDYDFAVERKQYIPKE